MPMRFLFRCFYFVLILGLLWGCLPGARAASGQTPAPAQKAGTDHRWLFIIETSAGMKARSQGLAESLRQFLNSRMDDQVADGQSIGLWTFDRSLSTGRFPLQRWEGQGKSATTNLLSFIQKQPFENAPDIATFMPPLSELVRNSDLLTVILISTGQGELKGTPFDEAINREWATWRSVPSSRPLFTALRGVRGKWVSFKVSSGDFPVELPPLPEPQIVRAETNAPPAGRPQAAPEPTNVVGPLIFKGPNKRAESEVATNQATIPAQPAATNTYAAGTATNTASPGAVAASMPVPPKSSNALAVAPPQALPGRTEMQSGPPPSISSDEKADGQPQPKVALSIWVWAGSAVFLLMVLILAFLWLRRPTGQGTSLITESIDREK